MKSRRRRTSRVRWQIHIHQRVRFAISRRRLTMLLDAIINEIRRTGGARRAVSPTSEWIGDNLGLGIYFVGSQESRKLNKIYRGKNHATDVLSFEGDPHGPEPLLGELVFCVPVLRRQAREHRLTQKQEFEYLFIHGVLHLLGYEHEKSKSAAQKMFKIQDSIFEKLVFP